VLLSRVKRLSPAPVFFLRYVYDYVEYVKNNTTTPLRVFYGPIFRRTVVRQQKQEVSGNEGFLVKMRSLLLCYREQRVCMNFGVCTV